LILEILVALAAINVVNLLLMSAHQRRRDIAILRAMGMSAKQVFRFFLIQGTLVGFLGISFGVFFGWAVVSLFSNFQPNLLSESVYNVTKLPMKIELGDVSLVVLVAFFLCVIFSVVPAIRASKMKPALALRYE
jgi:lipoprotein-releasing system permease protein